MISMQSTYCPGPDQCISHCHQKTYCHRLHNNLWSKPCSVYFQNKIILIGEKDPNTDLWQKPLQQHQLPTNQQTTHGNDKFPLPNQQVQHMTSNLYTLPYKQQQIKYMHQTFFAPLHTTLLKAIDKGHLKNIPFMTRDNVMKFLANNPATSTSLPMAMTATTSLQLPSKTQLIPPSSQPSQISLKNSKTRGTNLLSTSQIIKQPNKSNGT